MIHSKQRNTIVDYLGTHQHLAVDLACSVDDSGAMCLRSGEQRFYERRLGFRFPQILSGIATVREWWDEDAERFRINVHVANKLLGPLFGYHGSFTVDERPCPASTIPADVLPVRVERRE